MLILALGCLYRKPPATFVDQSGALPKKPGVVGVAEPVFLAEGSDDAFADGVYVGSITMSGGFIVEGDDEHGMQTRSKEYAFSSAESYRVLAAEFVSRELAEALTDDGVVWRSVDVDAPLPERHGYRGTHPEDRKDNVNLPRFTLSPTPLAPASADDVEIVLVPYVVRYYSHNGGWFYGQELGCEAGARLRVFWVAYDNASGAPLAHRDIDVRHFEEHLFSPSSAQLEDALIEVEGLVSKDLDKHLF